MADEEPKIFTLTEAERTRREVEPLLVEAMQSRKKVSDLERSLGETASRIMLLGGMLVPYAEMAQVRRERDQLAESIQKSLDHIHSTGCVVKDLDMGLLDFPSLVNNQEVFLCWRLGEDRIRYYHRLEEGFAGRKPLDPHDTGPATPIQ